MHAIEVSTLTKRYPGDHGRGAPVVAVDNLSFSVPRGEVFGILRANGAGKTTTGVLFSTIPGQGVGSVMMPATLVRWHLLFVSGVFVPLGEFAPAARTLAYLSPLTYANDALRLAFAGDAAMAAATALGALASFWLAFLVGGLALHERGRRRA